MMQKEVWLNFSIVIYLFCNKTHQIYSLQMKGAYLLKQKQDKIVMPKWSIIYLEVLSHFAQWPLIAE